jgi:hypothetical protein
MSAGLTDDGLELRTTRCPACEARIPPPLDRCLGCGTPALFRQSEGGEWAVEAGPVVSQAFRESALDRLESAGLIGLDRGRAERQLAHQRVRVAEGLSKPVADTLVEHLGRLETQAAAVRGPATRRGITRPGTRLPLVGTLALTLVLGIAVGHLAVWLLGLAVAGGLLAYGAARPLPRLGQLPELPTMPHGTGDLLGRLFDAAEGLSEEAPGDDESDRARLLTVGRQAFSLLVELDDREDMRARIVGGARGELGETVIAAAREMVALGEEAALSGGLTAEQRARLGELEGVVHEASRALERVGEVEVVA